MSTRTTRRVSIAAAAVIAAAAAALFGGSPSAQPPAAAPPAVSSEAALSGFALGDTARSIQRLQETVRNAPQDQRSLALLGLAYQQRARETADASYLTRSEGVLRRAARLAPDDPLAVGGLASLAASRHDFRESLRLARRVVALAPDTARGYGILGDSLIELGRYDEAFRAFEQMVSLKPSLGAYARIAYARELLGRPRQALAAMRLALSAAGGLAEPTAWTLVEIGKLHFALGETALARESFEQALHAFPGYGFALDGLARATAASGRYGRAVALAGRAVDAVPLPQFVATVADLGLARGDRSLAREQYALMGTIQRLQAANGVNSDLELALFRIDHGIRLRETLALARRARLGRPSIFGDDVLAWALARNGRCAEALPYSRRSLRLGTKDASFYFHRGMIERCLGNRSAARSWFVRALETNPRFSLVWAPTARRYAS